MPPLIRDQNGDPILTGQKAGMSDPAIWADHTPTTSFDGPQFFIAELDASRPAVAGGSGPNPLAYNAAPWNALSLNNARPLSGSTVTFRASDMGYRTAPTDIGGVVAYPPLLTQAIDYTRDIPLDPAQNAAGQSGGNILFSNASNRYDGITGTLNSDGRPLRIKWARKVFDDARGILLDPAYSALTNLFIGKAGVWKLDVDTLRVPIKDASYLLDRPYQRTKYSGSGGYGGNATIQGQSIPRVRGGTASLPVKNITPVLIDPTNRIYQYNDGPGTVVAIYEGAAAVFTPGVDTTDLYSGTTAPGSYRTDNSRGLFQLGSSAVNAITADVTGQFTTAGAVTNVVDIARYIITEDMGVSTSDLDLSRFTSAAAAYPYTAGFYFASTEEIDGVVAVSRVLASIGAKLISGRTGELRCFVLRALAGTETPVTTLSTVNVVTATPADLPDALDPPPYRVRVGWNRNWTVQNGSFNGLATEDRKQFVANQDTYATYTNSTLGLAYEAPNDLAPFGFGLLTQANAQAVADGVGALWCGNSRLYDVEVPAQVALDVDLADVVLLRYPMDDLYGGKLGRIVKEAFNSSLGTATLQVLVNQYSSAAVVFAPSQSVGSAAGVGSAAAMTGSSTISVGNAGGTGDASGISGTGGALVGDYFVSNAGNDANTGTDRTQPFKTLAKAQSVAGAGKTIIVMDDGGTFNVTAAVTFGAGNTGCTIIADAGHTPVFDGGGGYFSFIIISGGTNTRVQGLTFQNTSPGVDNDTVPGAVSVTGGTDHKIVGNTFNSVGGGPFLHFGNNHLVDGNFIYSAGAFSIRVCDVLGGNASSCTVRNNTIANGGQSPLGIEGGSIEIWEPSTGNLITHNDIRNSGYNGIFDESSGGNTISKNYIENWNRVNNDGGGIYMFRDNVTNNVITDNFITQSTSVPPAAGTESYGIYLDDLVHNTTVSGNYVQSYAASIYIHGGDDNTVTNNVCVSGTFGFITQVANVDPTKFADNTTVRWNVFSAPGNAAWDFDGTNVGNLLDDNVYIGDAGTAVWGYDSKVWADHLAEDGMDASSSFAPVLSDVWDSTTRLLVPGSAAFTEGMVQMDVADAGVQP